MFWQTIVVLLFLAKSIEMLPGNTVTTMTSPPRYPSQTGKSTINKQIIGGVVTPITYIPFQVAILSSGSMYCGGSIVSPLWIVTAAHCAQQKLIKQYSVRVGSGRYNTGGNVFEVVQIVRHQNYSSSKFAYDAALFKLNDSITYSDSVSNVALPTQDPVPGSYVNVSGWGRTDSGGISLDLRRAEVIVNSTAECKIAYPKVHDSQFCAAYSKRDSCQGDSGGPLYSFKSAENKQYLEGIVAWGNGCALDGYPGVYTKVFAVRTWISITTGI